MKVEERRCERIMQYRPYGRTGIQVSTLGFGAMRLPERADVLPDGIIDERLKRSMEESQRCMAVCPCYLVGSVSPVEQRL